VSSPALVRVRLRFTDVETFVERFCPNVTRGGLFLATRNLREVGETVGFEIALADGTVVLAGEGKISWTKAPDPAQPSRPFGMGVQFLSLQPASKPVLARLLQAKEKRPAQPLRTTGVLPTLDPSRAETPPPDPSVGPGRRRQTAALGIALASSMKAASRGFAAGTPAPPRVDPHVDLAAEMGLDENALRDVTGRLRHGPRLAEESLDEVLEDLLKKVAEEPPTIGLAVRDLPRLLGGGRRRSGLYRSLEGAGSGPLPLTGTPAPVAAASEAEAAPVEDATPSRQPTEGRSDELRASS